MGNLFSGTSLKPLENKIDALQTDTTSVEAKIDTILDEVVEIETHLHSYGRFLELAGTPTGETHVAVSIGDADGAGAFIPDAGDSSGTPTWGAWVQLLGSSDTPVDAGKSFYDLHRILISSAERNAVYFLQIAYGDSGGAALTAGTYDEEVYSPASNQVDSGPVEIQIKRVAAGTKAWVRIMCPGQNTAMLSLYPGLHEYD